MSTDKPALLTEILPTNLQNALPGTRTPNLTIRSRARYPLRQQSTASIAQRRHSVTSVVHAAVRLPTLRNYTSTCVKDSQDNENCDPESLFIRPSARLLSTGYCSCESAGCVAGPSYASSYPGRCFGLQGGAISHQAWYQAFHTLPCDQLIPPQAEILPTSIYWSKGQKCCPMAITSDLK